jgi:hypothetical protein
VSSGAWRALLGHARPTALARANTTVRAEGARAVPDQARAAIESRNQADIRLDELLRRHATAPADGDRTEIVTTEIVTTPCAEAAARHDHTARRGSTGR